MRNVPGHGKNLSYYQFGATTMYACQYDKRFSYCLYVPHGYDEDADTRYPLVVAVHGTARSVQACRDLFADFCERHNCVVLAPLFPAGIERPGELSDYKFIGLGEVRYDQVLLAMVDEVAAVWRLDTERFMLTGFSGGGHFTHRFAYLHPDRLRAISVASPGVVTLLDEEHPWWVGVGDVEERFGRPLDLDALRQVAVHMVVGGQDTETWEITIRPGDRLYQPGAELQGSNRIERIHNLAGSFEKHGIQVQLDVVPGVAHELAPLTPATQAFFRDALTTTTCSTG